MTDRKTYMQDYHKEYRKVVHYASVPLPRSEYERIVTQANELGLKPSVYMRALILKGGEQYRPVPPAIEQELKELRLLMRNIANNVNQMARHSNTIRHVDDEQGLFKHLHQLEETILTYTRNRLRDP